MTTPKAILVGFGLVALAIASLPYSNGWMPKAQAFEGCATQIEIHMIQETLDAMRKLQIMMAENQKAYFERLK